MDFFSRKKAQKTQKKRKGIQNSIPELLAYLIPFLRLLRLFAAKKIRGIRRIRGLPTRNVPAQATAAGKKPVLP
jgi:hypothetical protein